MVASFMILVAIDKVKSQILQLNWKTNFAILQLKDSGMVFICKVLFKNKTKEG